MTKKCSRRFRIVAASVIVLAFSCVKVAAGNFVYEAVPFQLATFAAPDDPYTIFGTFTTPCNDCLTDVVDWEIFVDGPSPAIFCASQ